MPGMTGVEATRQITAIAPLTRVLVLTISDQDGDVMDAILAGACGYLLKDSSIQELMRGIESPRSASRSSRRQSRRRCCSGSARRASQPESERSVRSSPNARSRC